MALATESMVIERGPPAPGDPIRYKEAVRGLRDGVRWSPERPAASAWPSRAAAGRGRARRAGRRRRRPADRRVAGRRRRSRSSPTSATRPRSRAPSAGGARFGGLDVVVPNAAVQLTGHDDRADRLDADVWRRTLDANLTGAFLTAKHGVRALLATGGGAVVCAGSPAGHYGSLRDWTPTRPARPAWPASCASWRPTTPPTASASTACCPASPRRR